MDLVAKGVKEAIKESRQDKAAQEVATDQMLAKAMKVGALATPSVAPIKRRRNVQSFESHAASRRRARGARRAAARVAGGVRQPGARRKPG